MEAAAAPAPRLRSGSIRQVWDYRELLRQLVGRELKVKYKRSVFGWLWSLMNPLLMAGIYTIVFSFFFGGVPPIGNPSGLESFAIFVLCGLLSWNFTSNVLSTATISIVAGADLVRKVYFPRSILVFGHSIALLVSFALELAVLLVLILVAGGKPSVALVMLPVLMLLQTLFVSGVGLLTAGLNVFFRDLQHLLGILLTMWFFATPIVYPAELIKAKTIAGIHIPFPTIMALNPMAAFVRAYRDVLYHGRFPGPRTMAYLVALAVVAMVLFFAAFKKMEPRFAEEI